MSENVPTPVTPFQIRQFSDIAAELIRERILRGQLTPGMRINEVALSEELKVSRPPLREALRLLSGEGLLQLVPGRGAYVTELDRDQVGQVGELREALECAAARLAAERMDADDDAAIERLLDEADAELTNPDRPYPHHIAFHHALAAAAKNPRLAGTLLEVVRQQRMASMRSNEDPARAQQVQREHRALMAAIRAGDPDAAEVAMRTHIRATNAAIDTLFDGAADEGRSAHR